ncbi:MAG: bifunctional folylpolyglutamate synthase/dihydrofolate synthase [Oscillospiraceae bacterium]|nr:bifunctional folylpolyglutamate synthase/dihydrofolate synthase [Oscillospiraceae bacterium]
MTYQESEKFIHSFRRFTKVPGLAGIRLLLEKLGDPQKKLKFLHIAGTNGKGSTTAMSAAILKEAGYRVGMFVSPYVLCFRERVQINGEMIPEADMIRLCQTIKTAVEEMEKEGIAPAEFEVVTALGMLWFAEQKCDIVCIEVGLGGRFDATNVIEKSLASVICAIGFDHTQILGDTLSQIAFEKCGILKEGGICVCYPRQEPEALGRIMEECAGKNNRLMIPNAESVEVYTNSILGSHFRYGDLEIRLPLAGDHQICNCLTVMTAMEALKAQGFAISDKDITNGIEKVTFPARLERISAEPLVVLDGAHNPHGCRALAAVMQGMPQRKIVIMGMLQDKDWQEAVSLILKEADLFLAVSPNYPGRALPAGELADFASQQGIEAECFDGLSAAVEKAASLLDRDTALICCGSLYLAGDLRPLLQERFLK